jgi:alkaline phosphatase D
MKPIDRRTFTTSVAAGIVATSAKAASEGEQAPIGPMVGHVSTTSANLWYRPAVSGKYTVQVRSRKLAFEVRVVGSSTDDNDRCLTWRIDGLKPATRYQYSIHSESETLLDGKELYFETAPEDGRDARVCLAFGSCAHAKPLSLWTQIEQRGAEGLVLLGDTPYIDSTNLATARRKHGEFLSTPQLAAISRHMPVWGTWDDHDFGKNDSDGRLKGKERSRQAFVEYRANESYGEHDQGIYTKFRRGPVEVFLLDTRWFARTEPSPVDPKKLTLLGRRQWDWLLASLEKSTAPFKVIACGMIWDAKKNFESDDWETYSHERSALFEFLGAKNISGVVLIGGDIHCSRLLRYKTEEQVGYPLHQMIVSPIHSSTISSLNVAHPDLIRGEAIPHVWLRLEADTTKRPATLHAEWVQMDGRKMWDLKLSEDDLRKTV